VVCEGCGQPLPAGAKFCMGCGAPVAAPDRAAPIGAPATPRHLAEKILATRTALEPETVRRCFHQVRMAMRERLTGYFASATGRH